MGSTDNIQEPSYSEPPNLLASLPQSNQKIKTSDARQDDINVEESEEVRLERLGRMRPEKFHSLWEEMGFCFSVVMSQALTVCTRRYSRPYPNLTTGIGILCLWLQCHLANCVECIEHTKSESDLAGRSILPRRVIISLDIWTSG
jgi:hypothetical protein